MDLFVYNTPDTWSSGYYIGKWDSVYWAERYREPGEFEIKAPLSSGLKDRLPIGAFISHMRTLEVMMVENHQITEEVDSDPILVITGRSLETILDQRVVGQNRNWTTPPASISVSKYELAADDTWDQAVILINDHIRSGVVITSDDAIPLLYGTSNVIGGVSTPLLREVSRGSVHERLMELLEVDNLGIRVIRRIGGASATVLQVHNGVDKRKDVVFSTLNGDIDSADYLWSIKKLKTAALVSGQYVETMIAGTAINRDKRVMLVDGSDIDGSLDAIPTGATLTTIRSKMTTRGNQALQKQKSFSISRTDISQTPTYTYRVDYNIGDQVTVDTSFGKTISTRVIEHVEISDETGESSHPTLEIVE